MADLANDTTASPSSTFIDDEAEEEASLCSEGTARNYDNWPLIRKGTVWMPEFSVPQTFDRQMNFFNWLLLKERAERQILLDAERPVCGKYYLSRGEYSYNVTKPSHVCGVYAIRFSHVSDAVACGYGNGLIEVVNYKTKSFQVVKERRPRSAPISSIRFHPHEDLFFASTMSGVIYSCPKDKGKYNFDPLVKENNNEITAIDINPGGTKIASVGRDACVRIYDVENKELEIFYNKFLLDCNLLRSQNEQQELVGEGHYGSVFAVVFCKEEPEILATGGNDCSIKIWDLRVPFVPVKTIHGPHITGDAVDIMDGKVVSGQWSVDRKLIQLWDLRSTRLLKTIDPKSSLTGAGHYTHTLQFLQDEGRGDLILVGFNKGLGIISISENRVICKYSDEDNIVCADNFKEHIVYGGMNSVISFARFRTVFNEPIPTYENILLQDASLQRFLTEEHLPTNRVPIVEPMRHPVMGEHEEMEEDEEFTGEASAMTTPLTTGSDTSLNHL